MPFPFSCRPSLLSAILFESSSLIAFPRSSYGIGIALLPLFYLMTTGLRREPPSAAVGALRGMALSRSGVMCRYSVRRAQARRKRLGIRRLELSSQVAGGGGKVISNEKYSKNTESESRKRDSDLSESKNNAEKRVSELSLSYSSSSETHVVFPRIEAMKSWRSITCLPRGSVSLIGRRSEMEDAVRVEPGFLARHSRVYDFFGVYDGHGGSRVAQACRDRLHRLLKEEIEEIGTFESTSLVDWEKVMVACFEKMDEEVNDNRKDSTALSETIGSTAVVAVVGAEVVVVANCGDSRAVLSREGVAVSMSNDHKPDRPDELERIEGAGGRVINWNGHRVLGVLATSRSIGDHYLKPFVIPKPDVAVSKRTNRDEFLILASDGLWDVVSNEVACHVVRQCLYGKMKRSSPVIANGSKLSKFVKDSRAADAAALLAEMAMARGSEDNISVVVVNLNE